MHYYQHHIGDFIRDTARLTDEQSMAYLRMIWLCYESEQPLPDNSRSIGFKIGASPEIVELIFESFFKRDGDTWRHTRCDAEIEEYKAICNRNKTNGKAGGRPKKTQSVASGSRDESQSEPRRNPNHKPITNNQLSKEDTHTHSPPQGCVSDFEKPKPTKAAECAMAMKRGGIGAVSPQHPELLAMANAGIEPEQFEQAAQAATAKNKGFAYALGILKGQLREANAITTEGLAMPEKPWDESRSSIEAEGERLGLGRWDEGRWSVGQGPSFAEYTKRVSERRKHTEAA